MMDQGADGFISFEWQFGRERHADRESFEKAVRAYNADQADFSHADLHRIVTSASVCSLIHRGLDAAGDEYEEKLLVIRVPDGQPIQLADLLWQVGEAAFDVWQQIDHRYPEVVSLTSRGEAIEEYSWIPALAEALKTAPEPIFELNCGS